MKRVKSHIAIVLAVMTALCFSAVPSYAEPETTTITDVNAIVPAADNDKYMEVDLDSGEVTNSARETVPGGFEKIFGEEYSESGLEGETASAKEEQIKDLAAENDCYSVSSIEDGTAEITAKFATCRLVVMGHTDIETFGAIKTGSVGENTFLRYSGEQETADAYKSLCERYGSENVLIDMPVKADSSNWSYDSMNLKDAAEAIDTYGRDITVAVVDSGIEKTHNVFKGRTILKGYNTIEENTDTSDYNGHGTYVSSVIVQGTGSNVKLLPVKALDENGEGSLIEIAAGVEWAADAGADLINMSLSGDMLDDPEDQDEVNLAINTVSILDNYLEEFSGPIFASAGNSKRDIDTYYTWPAVSERTIAVSGLKNTDSGSQFASEYSNYGEGIDYSAPATGIYMADFDSTTTYSYYSGTSFAAPHLTAAAALLMSHDSSLKSKDQVTAALDEICVDLGDPGKDIYYGNGCPVMKQYESKTVISKVKVGSISDKVYSGSAFKPSPSITYNGKKLVKDKDYKITYSSNKNVGKAKLAIKGIGDYSKTRYVYFKIKPKRTYITGFAKGKKQITVKWKKQPAKMSLSRITGYQVQVATNSKFTSNSRKVSVSGYSKISKKITSLKAKKKYYVRVRTYKTLSGVRYYSNWSTVKTVKTK